MNKNLLIDKFAEKTKSHNPKTAREVLNIVNKLSTEEKWHKKYKVNRMAVYFRVCSQLDIDCENMN